MGTEELAHLEIVGSLVSQLSKGAPPKEWNEMESWQYYADNGASVFPQNSQGSPFNAASIAVTGDPLTNLYENLAAEQKARAVYDNILRLSDDPDVNEVIKFLRQREVVHFQRFGEAILTVSNRFLIEKIIVIKRITRACPAYGASSGFIGDNIIICPHYLYNTPSFITF